jgi:hypothetical protein
MSDNNTTYSIANDIKNKIKDYKNRKSLSNRENELDIDVNIEMLNKFKKNKHEVNNELKSKKFEMLKNEIDLSTNKNYSINDIFKNNKQTTTPTMNMRPMRTFLLSEESFDRDTKSEDK